MRALITITLAFAAGGCSLWTKNQLEGFEEADGGVPTACNLELQFRGFPHPRHPILVRGVRAANTELVALAVIDPPLADPGMLQPGTEADLDIVMPNAFPDSDVRIDFFADIDLDGSTSTIDHTWSIDDPCGNAPNLFPHDAINLDVLRPPVVTGETFHARITGVPGSVLFELRVSEVVDPLDPASNRTVGIYRTRSAAGLPSTVDVVLEGILVPGGNYLLEMWSDLDNDASYDAPAAGDLSSSIESPEEFVRDCDELANPGCTFTFPLDTADMIDIGRILITRP